MFDPNQPNQIEQRLKTAEQLIDIFQTFSTAQMSATTGIHQVIGAMREQITEMQKDIALIKESLVALSSKRH